MATLRECEAALQDLAGRLDGVDAHVRRRHAIDRTIACTVSDLDRTFSGHLRDGSLQDIVEEDRDDAQIRLTVRSDDLLALTDGRLHFASAWATGRLKVEASMMDLLRLRSLL